MRLDRLELTRYGHFTDMHLDLPAPAADGPDLHILYGPNEAGKSTLFNAWLDLLFGIPKQTRYAFLHPGPSMEIGAVLSDRGMTHRLTRIKRDGPSLLDGHGAHLPEAGLQALLGGLTREGYRAMFSLDDETLEQGGDSILASKGELGELLFAASAGLAGLARRLEGIRTELDGFHRPRARSGRLHEGRQRLKQMAEQYKGLNVTAATLQKLQRDVAGAMRDWQAATQAQTETATALQTAQAALSALPLHLRLARLQQDLAPLAALPDALPHHLQDFQRHDESRLTLQSRLDQRRAQMQRQQAALALLQPDPAVLAAAPLIAAAETLRSAHDAALTDLPRRESEAGLARQALALTLARLGQDQCDPAQLMLPAARLARLRALLAHHSGLVTAGRQTTAEAERAAQFAAALAIPAGQGLASGPAQLIADNRRGEALLAAIADVDAGSSGDTARAAQGLTVLDALQQQEIARQAAVELILGPMMTGPQP